MQAEAQRTPIWPLKSRERSGSFPVLFCFLTFFCPQFNRVLSLIAPKTPRRATKPTSLGDTVARNV